MSAFGQRPFGSANVAETPNFVWAAKNRAEHERQMEAARRLRQQNLQNTAMTGGKYLYEKTGYNPLEAAQYGLEKVRGNDAAADAIAQAQEAQVKGWQAAKPGGQGVNMAGGPAAPPAATPAPAPAAPPAAAGPVNPMTGQAAGQALNMAGGAATPAAAASAGAVNPMTGMAANTALNMAGGAAGPGGVGTAATATGAATGAGGAAGAATPALAAAGPWGWAALAALAAYGLLSG